MISSEKREILRKKITHFLGSEGGAFFLRSGPRTRKKKNFPSQNTL